MAGGYGGVSSASGVPFYGQQNKMNPAIGFGGGAGAFGAPATGAAGGFTYGMAAKGGNLFGPQAGPSNNLFAGGTQFGANTQSQNPGLFQFGSVSQFGGMGNQALFGAGGGMGGRTDDPYANIAIDLNKVKKQEPPAKLYEHKTEEEKKKDKAASSQATNASTKSNLKKDAIIDEKIPTKPSVTST